ncbi:MAG: hypothetical protein ACE5OR_07945 [bacterium]
MTNRSLRIALFLTLFLLTLSAAGAEAAFEKRSFTLVEGDTLNENLYFGGRRLKIEGVVEGDIIAGAQKVFIRGRVANDVNVGAEEIEVEGTVGDDLRAFGRTVIVAGRVEGDILAFAAEVDICREAVVLGNLYVGAGEVIIDGQVQGSVRGGGGRITIAGHVGKDVDVKIGDELTLSPRARIDGDLTYSAKRAASLPDRDVVRGEVSFNRVWKEKRKWHLPSSFGLIWQVLCLVGALVVGLVLVTLDKSHARAVVAAMRTDSLKSIGLGFALLILVPILVILSVVFIISIPLGFIALLLYLVAFYVAKIYTGMFIGDSVLRSLGHETPSLYLSLLLGLALLYLLFNVPYIGWFIYLLAVMYGLGGVIAGRQAVFKSEGAA